MADETKKPRGSRQTSQAEGAQVIKPDQFQTVFDTTGQFTRARLAELPLSYDYKSSLLSLGSGSGRMDVTLRFLAGEIDAHFEAINFKTPFRRIEHELEKWRAELDKKVVETCREKLRWNGSQDRTELINLVKAVAGEERLELNSTAIEQALWQFKRKLYELDVAYHLMVIFYGKSGGGKSEMLRRLGLAVSDLFTEIDCKALGEERIRPLFQRFYFVYLDEMAHAERADVSKFKEVITSPTVSYRPMRTNDTVVLRNNATFFGSTNREIIDIIYDPTSARRYYQVNCLPMLNWDVVNNTDYLKIWQSVNENAEAPIKALLPELQNIQEQEIRGRDTIENFVFQCTKIEDPNAWLESSKVYLEYKNFCTANGFDRPVNNIYFGRRLKQLNVPFRGDRPRYYGIRNSVDIET